MAIQVSGPARRPGPLADGGDLRVQAMAVVSVTLKLLVILAMVRVAVDPGWANLDGKAPVARAVLFPLAVSVIPAAWVIGRRTGPFPWLADLLVTLTCFADVLGNRLDLYDSVTWFDDWMHLSSTGMVGVVCVILTLAAPASFPQVASAAIAGGLTASLGWELFEYATFLTRSTEWSTAYSDTIGDLALGWIGSLVAACVVVSAWRSRDT